MVRTVIEINLHVDDVVAGENTGEHSALDTLINRRNVLLRDGATNDRVNELIALSWVWLDLNLDVTVLTTTAGLSSILLVDVSITSDGLLVCNLRLTDVCFNLKLA